MFLNNKTEGLSSESTMKNLLVKMGEELGVDVDHKIPVAMPGQRGTLETRYLIFTHHLNCPTKSHSSSSEEYLTTAGSYC